MAIVSTSANRRITGSAHSEAQQQYRADVDGLRAVAVASVVLYHAGIPGFSGGFVGVDIFFVISGYLIGGIVYRDVLKQEFSFKSFYARRAKRILPALFGVTIVQFILAILLLSPSEICQFAKSAAAALVGVSNIRFWRDTGYFAPDAHLDPFLMTWSLGVEEQFYLVLPPALLLLNRIAPARIVWILTITSVISLILSVTLTAYSPTTAFYLLPARAWELGAGVILALWRKPEISQAKSAIARTFAPIGFLAIAIAITTFDSTTAFPGLAAGIPVFGSVALLASDKSWINRLILANTSMRFVGLLSYSWYLWHWPLMAFVRVCYGSAPPSLILASIALIALALAYISWRFIELPFRHAHGQSDGKILVIYSAILSLCVLFSAIIYVGKGFPDRLPTEAALIDQTLSEGRGAPCLAGYGESSVNRAAVCVDSMPHDRIALVGDSHAAALGDTLRGLAMVHGVGFTMMTKSSCPALYSITRRMALHPEHALECARYNRQALDSIIHDPLIRTVVMTGFWSSAFETQGPNDGYALTQSLANSGTTQQELFQAGLIDTLHRLTAAGKRVIILGDVPLLRFDPTLDMYSRYLPLRGIIQHVLGAPQIAIDGTIGRSHIALPAGDSNQIVIRSVNKTPSTVYRSLSDAMCMQQSCRVTSPDGRLYYIDNQHLSELGAKYALDRIGAENLIFRRPDAMNRAGLVGGSGN